MTDTNANSTWRLDTQLAHLGRESGALTNSVNPPLVRASTTVFATLAEFKQSYKGVVFESPRYGRSGTSTNFELQSAMAQICRAETCMRRPLGSAPPLQSSGPTSGQEGTSLCRTPCIAPPRRCATRSSSR